MRIMYNVAVTRRILNLPTNAQVKIQIWHKVIWVHIEGQRPTLISKKNTMIILPNSAGKGLKLSGFTSLMGLRPKGQKRSMT